MTGKIVVIFTLVAALIVGGAIYYLQVYGYYREMTYHPGDITMVVRATGQPEEISVTDYRAIDADSSPLRYRACFTVMASPDALDRTFEPYEGPEPLTGPGWFDCYDAGEITTALETGEARAFLARKNIEYGVDRVIAVFRSGRAFAWHQLNKCGELDYAGTPVGEACPPREDR